MFMLVQFKRYKSNSKVLFQRCFVAEKRSSKIMNIIYDVTEHLPPEKTQGNNVHFLHIDSKRFLLQRLHKIYVRRASKNIANYEFGKPVDCKKSSKCLTLYVLRNSVMCLALVRRKTIPMME